MNSCGIMDVEFMMKMKKKILNNRFFFFFNDTATTEIYTLSLHDALPISRPPCSRRSSGARRARRSRWPGDRKSTRLNSSHANISYAVFCLKKKKLLELLCGGIHDIYYNTLSLLLSITD